MDIKFTDDGKKVVVLGNLNQQEMIVQEIFIIEGQEVPSGKNFIVTSLHDAPAKSWKQEQIEKLEKEYKEKKEWSERRLEEINKEYTEKTGLLMKKLDYIKESMPNLDCDIFNRLVNFMTGKIQYIVILSYDPKIIKYDEFQQIDAFHDLKLISLFGKRNGQFDMAINQYSDGSGSWNTIMPCTSYDEALGILQNHISSVKSINEYTIKVAKKYGLTIPQELIEKYKTSRRKQLDGILESQTKSIDNTNKEIKELEDL